MLGLMQDWPLTVDKILDHAKAAFPRREIVTRSLEGPISRSSYLNLWLRSKQVTNALREHGVTPSAFRDGATAAQPGARRGKQPGQTG